MSWKVKKKLDIKVLNKPVYKAMQAFMPIVQSTATRLGRKDTRNMTNSLRTNVKKEGNEVTGKLYTNVHYAIHQEFGTSRMSAQPFMRPGILDNIRNFGKLLRKYA